MSLEGDVIRVEHPTTHREYQKTKCVLGTVFQDQASFLIRRRQPGFPELLNESLDVTLACGYAAVRTFDCADEAACKYVVRLPKPPHPEYTGCRTHTGDADGGVPSIVEAEFSKDEQSCTVTLGDAWGRYQFAKTPGNPGRYPVPLGPNEHVVRFTVSPRTPFFDAGDAAEREERRDLIRCSVMRVAYTDDSGAEISTAEDMATAVVEVSAPTDDDTGTFHSRVDTVLEGADIPVDSREERVNHIAAALFYTYVWGWYTGFIEMPYYSIQGLLSNPPLTVSSTSGEFAEVAIENQRLLQRYRLLASLFIDESDDDFVQDHFGFLTPEEARQKYKDNHKSRFDAYLGRVLGVFLQELPPQYRRQ